jgi:hypothetical protein
MEGIAKSLSGSAATAQQALDSWDKCWQRTTELPTTTRPHTSPTNNRAMHVVQLKGQPKPQQTQPGPTQLYKDLIGATNAPNLP